jgi:drug/metabolite transporter (DMT)-like permease
MDQTQSTALIALTAAASWGGGDFCGGMGVRGAGGSPRSAVRFVLLAHSISLTMLVAIFWAMRGVWGFGAPGILLPGLWAMAGGVAGGLGLTAFYIALSRSSVDSPMGASAAVSGLIATVVPAGVSTAMEGRPAAVQLAGFVLAGVAIWLIAAGATPEASQQARGTMALAVSSGVGFGCYLVALRMANPLGLVEPMALARAGSLLVLLPLLVAMRVGRKEKQIPYGNEKRGSVRNDKKWWRAALKWALGVALLDTGGNMLFIAATRHGRLDVAAVLSSLYPASTILLAAWWLHERPTRRQLAGMVVALAAVVTITL